MQGREISHDSVVDKVFEGRHQAPVEQRSDDLPIGSVPTDQQDFLGKSFRHRTNRDGEILEKAKFTKLTCVLFPVLPVVELASRGERVVGRVAWADTV